MFLPTDPTLIGMSRWMGNWARPCWLSNISKGGFGYICVSRPLHTTVQTPYHPGKWIGFFLSPPFRANRRSGPPQYMIRILCCLYTKFMKTCIGLEQLYWIYNEENISVLCRLLRLIKPFNLIRDRFRIKRNYG